MSVIQYIGESTYDVFDQLLDLSVNNILFQVLDDFTEKYPPYKWPDDRAEYVSQHTVFFFLSSSLFIVLLNKAASLRRENNSIEEQKNRVVLNVDAMHSTSFLVNANFHLRN